MKKVLKNLGIALIVFLLVLLVGILVWEYSSEWRAEKSGEYLAKSEEYVEQGSGQALWEIEKAYWMGMDYGDFRVFRTIKMMELNDVRVEGEIEYLIEKNLGNDDFYFLYADRLYKEGNFEEAEKYLLKVGDKISKKYQEKYYDYLTYFAGLNGDWQSARTYSIASDSDSEFSDNMNLGLLLLLDEMDNQDIVEYDVDIVDKVLELKKYNGDLYIIKIADILIDLDLSGWARVLLDGTNWEGEIDRDLYLIYGKSLVKDGNCREALEYFLEAEKIDSVNQEVHGSLMQAHKCLGEKEWEEWERLKV